METCYELLSILFEVFQLETKFQLIANEQRNKPDKYLLDKDFQEILDLMSLNNMVLNDSFGNPIQNQDQVAIKCFIDYILASILRSIINQYKTNTKTQTKTNTIPQSDLNCIKFFYKHNARISFEILIQILIQYSKKPIFKEFCFFLINIYLKYGGSINQSIEHRTIFNSTKNEDIRNTLITRFRNKIDTRTQKQLEKSATTRLEPRYKDYQRSVARSIIKLPRDLREKIRSYSYGSPQTSKKPLEYVDLPLDIRSYKIMSYLKPLTQEKFEKLVDRYFKNIDLEYSYIADLMFEKITKFVNKTREFKEYAEGHNINNIYQETYKQCIKIYYKYLNDAQKKKLATALTYELENPPKNDHGKYMETMINVLQWP